MVDPLKVSSRCRGTARLTSGLVSLLAVATMAPLRAQTGPLFPQPFRVEHHLIQDDGDGSRFVGEPVVDTYGGSWIVSQRPDGGRLIVDLVRRELTGVEPERGTYWTVSFDRLAELQVRLRQAQGLVPRGEVGEDGKSLRAGGSGAGTSSGGPPEGRDPADELVVTELPALDKAGGAPAGVEAGAAPSDRPGVKHLRVARRGDAGRAALEVWVDPTVRLNASAQAAIGALEAQVLDAPPTAATGKASGAAASAAASPARLLAAVRAHASGALPVRTVRPLLRGGDGAALATVEDVATRLEPLDRFPTDLAEIPEGLRRVPHPLEATVRFLEDEAARNAAMSGRDDS